jgi:tetratricopeptide (TPR) repeat protein
MKIICGLFICLAFIGAANTNSGAQSANNRAAKRLTSAQIDALWNYDEPGKSCERFREAIAKFSGSTDELHTQIARSLGLQNRFDEAREELKKVSPHPSPIVSVRTALEAGRIENSSGNKAAAKPHFMEALDLAKKHRFDFYSIDAAHMLGIVTEGKDSLEWNEKAIEMAERSKDKRARGWMGSLLNNTGWTYHDMGDYEKALVLFKKAQDYFDSNGNETNKRIARWTVGRCLRSMKRYDEALVIMRKLDGGPEDGSVSEEMGELLTATGHAQEAKGYFKRAYEKLNADAWERANEAERLNRLKRLAELP